MNVVFPWILLAGFLIQSSESTEIPQKGPAIAALAKKQIGSTKYPYADNLWDYMLGDSYKGHLFVSDVLRTLNIRVPIRRLPSHPIRAEEWDDKQSALIAIISYCWRWCWDGPRPGDIVAYDGIVGIITGNGKITLSNPYANPPGLIMEMESEYVNGLKGTCWRLTC